MTYSPFLPSAHIAYTPEFRKDGQAGLAWLNTNT